MKLQVKSASAQGSNYGEVMQLLTNHVNTLCTEIGADPEKEIVEIRYEQSIQTYYMRAQCFYVTAFIHYKVLSSS